MVANSSKPTPSITSFQQQHMLHVEAIAESEIHIGSSGKLVRMFGTIPDYLHQLTDHGQYFTAKRVYTRDDDRLFRTALNLAEAHWPTNTAVHICDKCCKVAPALAFLALLEGDRAQGLVCHLATACGDLNEALNDMTRKAHFLRSLGLETFPVWIDALKYEVPSQYFPDLDAKISPKRFGSICATLASPTRTWTASRTFTQQVGTRISRN
jgi:hypothetical protein